MQQKTYRADRNPESEPEPTVETEERRPPSHLNKWAKRFWRDVCREMIDTGVLTVVDWSAFEMCCEAYGLYREAHEAIFRPVDEFGKKGKRSLAEYLGGKNSQTTPELTTMNKAMDAFLKYSNVLGLNPVARNRINLKDKPKEKKDPMEEMWDEAAE